MNSHYELSHYLQQRGVLKSALLIESFNTIDRKDFVSPSLHDEAYEDHPLAIGAGQTISQPYTVAFMLERLELEENDRILDIGCGSGWSTALLAQTARSGFVTGVELVPELLDLARRNLEKYRFANTKLQIAGEALGIPGQTFDKILVSAAAEELPQELILQLNPSGIMVIPVQNDMVVIFKREDGSIEQSNFPGFRFVPLIC
ncbi:MAG: methyltransferase domain-containing protein [Marinobacter sp.]|uniref:protein-L-isoaspartate O-methyltransferase family protein n=1 Tax=Marinobacter sp. TaxID=50741 RepID=UPI001B55CCA3|nr:methyltransferase domain-containing protein [Marinobacter sp.]MBQ0747433.1 methyltransferase domain-containing protein [Marinobacter sp.]MBQ0815089.1 methyltransferase domain-containing protein [Marinobacter sp.]|tara:strand:- start:3536 stop:4144 length:609 start_codon:yes stop_codon:yes gene_type:complete